jgi:cell division transport system permease protein
VIQFLRKYGRHHRYVLARTLEHVVRAPLASAMTVGAIGITLALPAGLYVAVENLRHVSQGWDTGGQISLYVKRDATDAAIERLADRLHRMRGVARVEYISRAQALAEFKKLSGFGEALNVLDRNPLPAVLVVHPSPGQNAEALQTMLRELRSHDIVDSAQLDVEWVRRLHALLALAERAVWALGGLLSLAVLLTIGNTIRLAVLNRRDEIEVMRLMGGTDAFIRRPFLYSGVIQGLLGAALTWAILGLVHIFLSDGISELTSSYGSDIRIEGLTGRAATVLLIAGAFLGWLGSRLAVSRHLRAIQPS